MDANIIQSAVIGTNLNIGATILLALCTALVLFMVPGLAIFYGGLVRKKNISTIMAQSFISLSIVTLIWIFGGFSLAFGTSQGGFIGNPADYFLFRNVLFTDGWNNLTIAVNAQLANGVPFILFFLFQLAFAIITPALVSGAFADRLSFRGYIIFTVLFTYLVYIPVCHWVWGGGFLASNGAIDWAGGIVIHATCGLGAIASVIALKKRKIFSKEDLSPNSIPLVAIGAGILFFGWFGFNVGGACFVPTANINSAITAISSDVWHSALLSGLSAFANSFIAMNMAIIVWIIFDVIIKKHTSLVSILTAGVAGLATITPTAGFIPIWASVIVGFVGGLICYWMCNFNHKIHFDDALEVWPVHGIGGIVGSLLVACFATTDVNSIILGSTQHIGSSLGSGYLFGMQLGTILLVCVWTFVFSLLTFYIIKLVHTNADEKQQEIGLDKVYFDEQAYCDGIKHDSEIIKIK